MLDLDFSYESLTTTDQFKHFSFFFLWYDVYLCQNLVFLSVLAFVFGLSTSEKIDFPFFIPTGIQGK